MQRETRGLRYVEVYDVPRRGRIRLSDTARPAGYAQQDLLGFTGETTVAVTALRLETGRIEIAYTAPTDGAGPPTRPMQLPAPVLSGETLQVAAEPLAQGSAAFEEPAWPAGDLAKLVGSLVRGLFAAGLYRTRRPRR